MATPDLREARLHRALDDLVAFHDEKHPRHEALRVDFYESCIANEIAPSGGHLLEGLIERARDALGINVSEPTA